MSQNGTPLGVQAPGDASKTVVQRLFLHDLQEQRRETGCGLRMSQQKPLKIIRAERLQSGKLGRSFYALHTHTDAYTVAKLHHQVYERVVESTAAQPLYKAPVNFHDVDRGVLEDAEGGITRSEIVHGHTQPQAAHLCQKSRNIPLGSGPPAAGRRD